MIILITTSFFYTNMFLDKPNMFFLFIDESLIAFNIRKIFHIFRYIFSVLVHWFA